MIVGKKKVSAYFLWDRKRCSACINTFSRNNLSFWSECIEPFKATSRPLNPNTVVFKVVWMLFVNLWELLNIIFATCSCVVMTINELELVVRKWCLLTHLFVILFFVWKRIPLFPQYQIEIKPSLLTSKLRGPAVPFCVFLEYPPFPGGFKKNFREMRIRQSNTQSKKTAYFEFGSHNPRKRSSKCTDNISIKWYVPAIPSSVIRVEMSPYFLDLLQQWVHRRHLRHWKRSTRLLVCDQADSKRHSPLKNKSAGIDASGFAVYFTVSEHANENNTAGWG